MRSKTIVYASLLLMFSGLCFMENSVESARPVEPADKSVSSVYALAGEFRTVFANLLWIKVDKYHHEFEEKNPDWTKNYELIGLLKMVTALDPHFVDAYEVGVYIYANGKRDNQKALSYLLTGLAHNPREWRLHKLAALIYARKLNNPRMAERHARLALDCCDDQWERVRLKWLLKSSREMIVEDARRTD